MFSSFTEKRLLQAVVSIACIVPVLGGAYGMMAGAGSTVDINLDSHFRYLSGLLLGIGIGFLTAVPRIEQRTMRFRLLTVIVVIGGIGRLAGVYTAGTPSPAMLVALVMELVVTPLLCLWQHRVARIAAKASQY